MGRDWSWLGGGGKKKSSKKDIKTTPSLSPVGNTATAAGCMSAVFNIFDFHHLQFPLNQHHLHLPQGVEPPRNSLESTAENEEEEEEKTPFSLARKDGNLNISMGFKIKTKPEARSSVTSTESYSPTIKTPTLVARLMGLDLVPDNLSSSSPTPSCPPPRSSSHTNKHRHYSLQRNSVDGGTRSLPETPRISLGRRSVDNVKIHEDKENRSPGDYAKQIVMQFKENVSRRRRMGNDITNVRSNKEEQSKKASKITIISTHDSSSSASSPRLEIPKMKQTSTSKLLETTVKVHDKTRLQTVQEEPHRSEQEQRKSAKKCKSRLVKEEPFIQSPATSNNNSGGFLLIQGDKASSCKKPEKFKSRLVNEEPFIQSPATSNNNNNDGFLLIQGDKPSSCKKPEKFKSRLVKEEPFIRSPATTNNNNNGDKTPLSINELTNFTTVPSLHTIKKQDSHRNRAQEPPLFPNQSQPHISINDGELEYITRTLRRTGIDKDTPISYAKWFSPTHPLDPSIFYFLEHFAVTSTKRRNSPENLSLRSNRKLLFHLLDEILADILKPQINSKPWISSYSIQSQRNLKGSELIDEISRRIEKFPLANCLVLEDIDELIAGDLPETTAAFEEEGEGIVTEVEKSILETLVIETTTDYYATWIKTASLQYNNKNVSGGTWGVHVTRHSSKVGSHYNSALRNPRV